MRIVIFNPYNNYGYISNNSIVIVNARYLIMLKKYLKHHNIVPKKVYKIINVNEQYEEIIAYYLKYNYYKKYKIDFNLKILNIWSNVIIFFNQRKYDTALFYIEKLENIDLLLDMTYVIKNNLEKLILNIEKPLLEEGVFLNTTYNNKKLGNSNCLRDNFKIINILDNISFEDDKWQEYNIYCLDFKNNIPIDTNDINFLKDRLFFISIHFYKISEYHSRNNNYVISYNMLHRTMGMFLYYLCKKINLSTSSDNLKKNFDKLKNANYSFSLHEENMIEKLNKSRNKLYLTHGLYSIQKFELKEMLSFIRSFIKEKDGNKWNNIYKKIRFNVRLSPLDLFMYEPSFDTYFIDITEKFKG